MSEDRVTPMPPRTVRARGLLHVCSVAGHRPEGHALALVAAPQADAAAAARSLDAIERAHALAAGDLIARPLGRGRLEGREYLALDAGAAFDGEHLLQRFVEVGQRIPYPISMGVLLRVADALARVHATAPAGSLAVGTLLPCQFVFDAGGQWTLLGLGDGALARAAPPGVPVAPEVQLGQAPDPRADGFAIAALMRSVMSFTALPPVIERALRGAERGSERGVGRMLREFQMRMWSTPPRLRPDAAMLAGGVRMFVRALGVEPDPTGFERIAAEAMAPEVAALEVAARVLRVAPDAACFELDGAARCSVASRAALRRLLMALLDAHRDRPGTALDPAALLAAGWPGERVSPESGGHRVHVAVSELRKMGLRGALERFDTGYRLSPTLAVRRDLI